MYGNDLVMLIRSEVAFLLEGFVGLGSEEERDRQVGLGRNQERRLCRDPLRTLRGRDATWGDC